MGTALKSSKAEHYEYSEDCLFLNVFAPETAREGDGLPVLIYIHGGGFTGGCAGGKALHFWQMAMKKGGCDTLEQFRALSPEKLFAVWEETKREVKGGGCFPCIDGRLVVGTGAELLNAGRQKEIPYMAGSTSEDMMPPILQSMAKKWCSAQEKPSYTWYFDRQLPGDENGAWHSSDLWYWFGTLENCWRPMAQKDRDLSDQMVGYLCNFAHSGDPNDAGQLPHWGASTTKQRSVLCMGETDTAMGKPNVVKMVKTMLTNKAVGE